MVESPVQLPSLGALASDALSLKPLLQGHLKIHEGL